MATNDETATNLVVLVPDAEPALQVANELVPLEARLQAPAHITLVYPFMPPATIDDRARQLSDFFSAQEPLTFQLRLGWFGREVLLLQPDPASGLVELTEAVIAQWPEYPYYGGAYDVIEPHVSLGFGTEARLAPIADAVTPMTPVSVTVHAVTVLVGPHEDMRAGRSFRLGG